MYDTIKKFLADGGKCLLIENGKPIGVVLTMEEYEKMKSETRNSKLEILKPEIKAETEEKKESVINPIGEAIAKEMDFPEVSANIDEINIADAGDVTLEDLGLDELPY